MSFFQQNEMLIRLLATIVVGGIIGLEREKDKQSSKYPLPVGIRTDILISILGFVSYVVGQQIDQNIYLITFIAAILYTLFPFVYLTLTEKTFKIKTTLSSLIVFLLGSLCAAGSLRLAITIAVATTFILSLKDFLHKAVLNIKYEEIIDAITFLIIAFVILPFLPDQAFDQNIFSFFFPNNTPEKLQQLAVLNPHRIWSIVVIISGVNFLGYILTKILGNKKGYSLTGLIGGIYSSTITSLTLSDISKKHPTLRSPFLAAINLACASSFFKMFVVLRALNVTIFERTLLPMGAMMLYLYTVGAYYHLKSTKEKQRMKDQKDKSESPFKLTKALKLATFLTGTLAAANLILAYANINLYYVLAALMAFFAVDDPIIISTSEIAGKAISFTDAKNIIIGVIFLNLIQKAGTMYIFGNRKLVKPLLLNFLGLFLVTAAGFLYL